MKMSFRGVSSLMTGAAFVTLAFLSHNCSPTGGQLAAQGGDNGNDTGGSNGNGGTTGEGGTTTGNGGTTGEGGTTGDGGTTGNGGSSTGNGGTSGKGGTTGKGGSSGKGGTTGNGGSSTSNGGSSTSNGGTTSSGGTTTSNGGTTTTPPPGSGGSGGGSTAAACTPPIKSTGGLACSGGLCTVGTYSGYTYPYTDKTSTICIATDSLCADGNTAVADDKGTIWGAGIGFNLDKSTTPVDVQLGGTGIGYALSAVPTQGMRIQVSVGGKDYCAPITAATGTVTWATFNTACWDNTGTALAAAPKTPHIGFQVTAAKTAGTFDFCVKTVTLQ